MYAGHRTGHLGRFLVIVIFILLGLLSGAARVQHSVAAPVLSVVPGPDATPDNAYPYTNLAPLAPGGPSGRALKTTMTGVGREALADRVLVSFASGTSDADIANINQQAAKLGAGAANPVLKLRNGSYLVDVSGATSVEAAAAAYRAADKRVTAASPDGTVSGGEATQPNDPVRGSHLDKIQAPAAWDRTHGEGVTIAILDTGIKQSNPDLAGKVDGGINTLWFSSGTDDQGGHGTGMAGIAGAATNNGLGIPGIGFNARLLAVKVLYDGNTGTDSAVASGIYWAADHGADIINMSLANSGDCEPWWTSTILDVGVQYIRDAINYAWSKNIVLIAGAGNSANTDKHYPASCPHVLSVAAVTNDDVLTSGPQGSTHGSWVQVAAPGDNILTTSFVGAKQCHNFPLPGEDFANCSGTSPATAVVSGIAALVRSSCAPISNQDIVDRITSTADPIAGTGTDFQFGRVNAGNAVCIPRPTGLHFTGATDSSISFAWTESSFETSFQFSYRQYGTNNTVTQTLPADTTQYTVSGLPTGTFYYFSVRACDARGCSEPSNEVLARANYLKLTVTWVGAGRITSTPAGINCGTGLNGSSCTAYFAPDTQVRLSAGGTVDPKTHAEYDFDHWEFACAGQGDGCTVTMNQLQWVKAVFVRNGGNAGP